MTRAERRLVTVTTVVAGVILAHAVAYLAAYPVAPERAAQLDATGHGYWRVAVVGAIVAGIVAVVTAAAAGRRGPASARGALPSFRGLAALQLLVFSGVEVVERLASDVPASAVLHSPAVAAGLVLQLVVAAAAVFLLRGVARAAAPAARRRPRRRRAAPSRPALAATVAPRTPPAHRRRPRAPPVAALVL